MQGAGPQRRCAYVEWQDGSETEAEEGGVVDEQDELESLGQSLKGSILAGFCSKCGGPVNVLCTAEQSTTSFKAGFFDHPSASDCFRSQKEGEPDSCRVKPIIYDIRPKYS
jgi:hypothetical protein